jgi:heat shock protein HspQ
MNSIVMVQVKPFVRLRILHCQIKVHSLFPANLAMFDGQGPTPRFRKLLRGRFAMLTSNAKYNLGQVVRHKKHPFRGVVFDIDPEFANTEEWYDAIPEGSRPSKAQPFYHLLAENDQTYYVAYVSEQNLVPDNTGEPVDHPDLPDLFGDFQDGRYPLEYQLN